MHTSLSLYMHTSLSRALLMYIRLDEIRFDWIRFDLIKLDSIRGGAGGGWVTVGIVAKELFYSNLI
jgi:hypothetical protein